MTQSPKSLYGLYHLGSSAVSLARFSLTIDNRDAWGALEYVSWNLILQFLIVLSIYGKRFGEDDDAHQIRLAAQRLREFEKILTTLCVQR